MPFVEQGNIQLIGATTENPSFKLTGALLSRCRVFRLESLTDKDVDVILTQASQRVSATSKLSDRVKASIVSMSLGDARSALSLLELVLKSGDMPENTLLASLKKTVSVSFDRTGDSHYDMISALHKSVRGSDADAAMYWLARMLTAGEDPMFIARRMAVCASEDVGLADNQALPLAISAMQACQMIGMPECRINLAHIVAYLALAPKSTRAYEAYQRAEEKAAANPSVPVPLTVRNAPTSLMEEMGYGKKYRYNPDYSHPVTNEYMPFKESFFDRGTKLWDEAALLEWEEEHGLKWTGRQS